MTTAGPTTVTPAPSIHNLPAADSPSNQFTPAQISAFRTQFIDLILQAVTQAITGILFPGSSASSQLTSWVNDLLGAFGGSTSTTGVTSFINDLLGAFGGSSTTSGVTSFITDLLGVFGGSSTTTGVGTWITDLEGLLGDPLGLGTGSVTPGALGSTPLLAPLQTLIDDVVGGSGNPLSALVSFLTTLTPASLQALIDGIVGGTGNPLSALISSLLGTQSTATGAASDLTTLISDVFGGLGGTGSATSGGIGTLLTDFLGVFGGATTTTGAGTFITDLLGAFGGSSTTTGLGSWVTDLLGILGSPTGLGGGSPTLGSVGSIPILGPLINEFITILGGTGHGTGVSGLSTIFTDLLGLLGNPTAVGSGSPGLASVGSIPILGPLINEFITLFTGTGSGITGLSSVFTDFLGIFGNPTGLGTGTVGLSSAGSIPVLGPLINEFITLFSGSGSGLTGLSSVFTDFLHLLGNPTGLGSGSPAPGSNLPILGTLFSGLGVSNLSGFLSFLTPTGSTSGGGVLGPLLGLFGAGTLGGLASGSTWTSSLIPNIGAGSGAGQSGDLQTVIDDIFQQVNGSTGTGNAPSTVGTSFGSIFDGFFQNITGLTTTGNSQANVSSAVGSQTNTIGGLASLLAQTQSGLTTGTPDSDAFERSGAVTPNWTFLASSGTGTLDGHNFHYSGSGSSADFVMLKNNLASAIDAMTSTIVTNNAVPSYPLFTPLPYGSYIDVWIRCTLFTTYATRSGVRLRINSAAPYAATYVLAKVASGSATTLTSGSCPLIGANTTISLAVNSARVFVAMVNGTPIFSGGSYTDAGNVTTLGASNRWRGFGGAGNSGIGLSTGTADIQQWTGA